MYLFIHSIGIRLYQFAFFLAGFFNKKAKEWRRGRKGFWNTLPNVDGKEVVWFHCASLGEFDQGIPVMQAIKQKADVFLIVTFFSPSGMNHYQKRNHPADWVGYLPLPTKQNAKRFIDYFRPRKIFFVKYEFWAHYLMAAKQIQSKTYCISANFRENQLFFGRYKLFFAPILFLFDKIFTQNENSIHLLEKIQYKNGVLAGDTRIDKVLENKDKIIKDEITEKFLAQEKAIILGSSWPVGENLWKTYIEQHPKTKFIIAPHDISEKHISSILSLFPTAIRYTKWNEHLNNEKINVLIIDCIGKLSNLYQYAKLAYVGGGFTGKLHNILEPSVFSIPVLFGPKHHKFPEAQSLLENGVGFEVTTSEELPLLIKDVLAHQQEIKTNSHNFFQENKNATQRILSEVF